MLGRICIAQIKSRRVTLEREDVMGLALLKVTLPASDRPRHLRRGAKLLVREGVRRVLVPTGFAHWSVLEKYGLRPVETEELCRAMACPLALAALRGLEVPNAVATVALRGERVTRSLRMAALALCSEVRNVVVSVPVGGEALQAELRREYGVPSLAERRERIPDVALHFSQRVGSGTAVFRLYGAEPDLGGLELVPADGVLPEDCARLPLMAALWEAGRLRNGAVEVFTEGET